MSAAGSQSVHDLMVERGFAKDLASAGAMLSRWQASHPAPTAAEMDACERHWGKFTAQQIAADRRHAITSGTRGALLIAAIDARRAAAQTSAATVTSPRSAVTTAPAVAVRAKPTAPDGNRADGGDVVALARKLGLTGASGHVAVRPASDKQATPKAATRDADGADVVALARKVGLHGVRPAGAA